MFGRVEKIEPLATYLAPADAEAPKLTPEQEDMRWILWAKMVNANNADRAAAEAKAKAKSEAKAGEAANP